MGEGLANFPLFVYNNDNLGIFKTGKDKGEKMKAFLSAVGPMPEAFGLMYFNEAEHRMKPLVYVDNPRTLVWENSCGSGSSAVASALAHRKKDTVQDILLRQPGGDLRLSAVWDKESVTELILGIDLAPQKRSVGYLFQQYALFPNMTVRENILAGTKKLPHEARSSFAEEMIERFHLKGLENHYPAQLSGGQQQRTALARITVSRPGAILLDESFSALDSYLKQQMEEELHTFLEEYPGEVILVSRIGKREEEKLTAGEHIVVCIDGNDVAFLSEH